MQNESCNDTTLAKTKVGNQKSICELNALSVSDLESLEKEVGYLKLSDFALLREKYETRKHTLTSLKHQLTLCSKQFKEEEKKEKKDQNTEILSSYRELQAEVKILDKQISEIETQIRKMVDRPSPFSLQNIKTGI